MFHQVLKVRCLSCPREARASGIPKTGKENVSFNVAWLYILFHGKNKFVKLLCISCWSGSYIIQKQKDPAKAHQVKLEVIVKALKWLEMDMDVDEVFNFLSPMFGI